MEIDQFRREYLQGGLHRKDLRDDPVAQFETWLAQAVAGGIIDPTAMVVATVADDGRPWQRIVLLKDCGHSGFVFYTNMESRKGRAIANNPQVSLHFPWNVLERQVSVAGVAEKLSAAEVAQYFLTRPRESQLAAWASAQSEAISSRAALEEKVAVIKGKFSGGEVPVPSFWGGYRVRPEQIEFWQGGAHRLHDRFLYTRLADTSWSIDRLEP